MNTVSVKEENNIEYAKRFFIPFGIFSRIFILTMEIQYRSLLYIFVLDRKQSVY